MSFILEALRKSESDRQRLGTVALADLPVARRRRGQPWWVFALSGLLLVNLLVLVLVLTRDKSAQTNSSASTISALPASATSQNPKAPAQASQAPVTTANPLQEAATPPAQIEYETVPASELELANAAASVPDGPTLVRPAEALHSDATKGMTADESNIANARASQDLRIDLHVYAKNARERFVLINMRRYVEGAQLPNGATVEQITPSGVVLHQNGIRYQLNRS